jgi:2'-5' RNA ligase
MNEAGAARIRAFLAVELGADVHARLVRLKGDLADGRAAVRWVRDDGLHNTIKFLGPVSAQRLEEVRLATSRALAAFPAFSVGVRGVGVFPSPRRPRVVWVGLLSGKLVELAKRTEAALEPLGFAREHRPYKPHVTLGRVAGPRGWAVLEERLKEHGDDDFGFCDIDRVIAFRSELKRGGAIYTKIWNIPLVVKENGGEAHGT